MTPEQLQRIALAHITSDPKYAGWLARAMQQYCPARTTISVDRPQGVSANEITVTNAAEWVNAINNEPSPKRIVIQPGLKRIHNDVGWAMLGGQFGSKSQTHGTDVEIIGNSCAITGYGLTIERGCNRVYGFDGASYAGSISTVPTPGNPSPVPKATLSDPLSVTGYSALSIEPPRNIEFYRWAFGFGPDMNVQIESPNSILRDCLIFCGLDAPGHIKYLESRHSKGVYYKANGFAEAAGARIQAGLIGTGIFGCDDRAPYIQGGVDLAMLGVWQVACRLGTNLGDHAATGGAPRVAIDQTTFTTAKQIRRDNSAADITRPIFAKFGEKDLSRLALSNLTINGTKYLTPFECWQILDANQSWTQGGFGGAFAGTKIPKLNRGLFGPSVDVAGYDPPTNQIAHVLANAGTVNRDPIQNWVLDQMQACEADPGNYEYELFPHESSLMINGVAAFDSLTAPTP